MNRENGNNEQEELLNYLELGEEARRFLDSPIGKFIQERSDIEVRQALEALQVVDPTDEKRIRELQNIIKVAGAIPFWLDLAIKSGEEAYKLAFGRED